MAGIGARWFGLGRRRKRAGRSDRKSNAVVKSRARRSNSAKRKRSVGRRLLIWPLRIFLLTGVACLSWVAIYAVFNPPGGYYMAREAMRLGSIERDWRDLSEISPRLVRAVLAAEDARFCSHYGFDFDAIQAAMKRNEQGKRVLGASTITQQTVKNVFLWHERSWVRKGLEAGFTVLVELVWSKHRIAEIYLNIAEFDEGVFGAEAASMHYFGRPAAALTPVQAARLAAILPNPKQRSASRPSAFVKRRARSIAAGAETLRVDGRADCATG